MATTDSTNRGTWNSKLGFILAAAGSAVGLGNFWGFPTQAADNGGATFILVYLLCILAIGFPVMVAELTIGRRTQKNPVGAFRSLSRGNPVVPLIGVWGVICGVMILAFYLVIAGWTLSYAIGEVCRFLGLESWTALFYDLGNGPKNAVFSLLFMIGTVLVITGGVSQGIERATKFMMPSLIFLLVLLIIYMLTLEGSRDGLVMYLKPDFSTLNMEMVLSALGQSFFSLSLGMGCLITYGSYLNRNENLMESAAWVTGMDTCVAFLAGLLVIPTMFVAQHGGIEIFNEEGDLISSATLVFDVLPALFHQLGGFMGLVVGFGFFLLLSLAALTSTISLLEVPVSWLIDEHGVRRKKAAWILGSVISLVSVLVSFDIGLIDLLVLIFNEIGLPLGGLMICLFLVWFWKTENALLEIGEGFESFESHWSRSLWVFFIRFVSPILIALVLLTTLFNAFS